MPPFMPTPSRSIAPWMTARTVSEAVAAANADSAIGGCAAGSLADTIIFDNALSGSTITLSGGQLVLTSTMTIDGGSVITVSGGNAGRVIRSTESITLTGLIIRDGDGGTYGGGIYHSDGLLTIANSSVLSNTASYGGGIYNEDGKVTLSAVQVLSNTAAYGGAIHNTGAGTALTVTAASLIQHNMAFDGGGIYNDGGKVTLSAAQVLSNTASNRGGAIMNTGAGPILNASAASLIQNNTADTTGGIYNDGGRVTLSATQVIANTSTNGRGGGIHNFGIDAVLNVSDASVIEKNMALYGGDGIYNEDGQVTLSAVQVLSNTTPQSGGGINSIGASAVLTVTDASLIQNKTADSYGGGIYNNGKVTLSVVQVISNTVTGGSGGGIFNGGQATLSAVQVLSNTATSGLGGGIANDGATAVLTVTAASLIQNNTAAFGGGGIYNYEGKATLSGVQVISNTATNGKGGGIYNSGVGAVLTMTAGSLIQDNTAGGNGGGIYSEEQATLSGVKVLSNSAGGGGIASTGFDAILKVTDSSLIQDNTADYGGGIYNDGEGTLSAVRVLSNTADSGGGIYTWGSLSMSAGSVIQNNTADSGGALYHSYGATTVADSCIVGNSDTSVFHDAGSPIDAANNWWGSVTGPSGFGPGSGDSVSANVNYSPFLAVAVLDCMPLPELGIKKTVSDVGPTPGDTITYAVVVANAGGATNATGGVINDTIPGGLTFVAGSATLEPASAGVVGAPPQLVSGLTITAGTSVTLTYQVTVDNGERGEKITNTASVTSNQVMTAASASAIVTVHVPEIGITGNGVEIANGAGSPEAANGTDFGSLSIDAAAKTQTFTISNGGDGTLRLNAASADRVQLLDNSHGAFSVSMQPANQSIAAADSVDFAISFDPALVGTFTATVSIDNNAPDEDPFTFAISGVGTGQAALAIEKSVETATAKIGDVIRYTVVVSNSGNIQATGITVRDTLPAGLSFVTGSTSLAPSNAGVIGDAPILVSGLMIPAGGHVTVTYQATATIAGVLTNKVEASNNDLATVSDSTALTVESDDSKVHEIYLPVVAR